MSLDGGGAKSVAISRKVSRLLDSSVNEQFGQLLQYVDESCPEVVASIGAQNKGSSSSAPAPAKSTKLVFEDRVLQMHQKFLRDFQCLRDAYRSVADEVDQLDHISKSMEQSLQEHRAEASELLASVGVLRVEMDEVRKKELQVKRFMEQYSLTQDETATIRGGEVNTAYLEVLSKVRTIHRSCKDLLAVNHQQAAVEIMESMYILHVTAVDRIVKYLLTATSEIMAHDIPDVTDVYVGCVRAVQDRPAQWGKVMHEVARVRKTAVLRRYYDLLTKGNARTGRPLEALANDVARFFGDLLAWLHQCLAEEGDLLDSLFVGAPLSSPTTSNEGDASGFGAVTKRELMDIIFESLCKHIKSRLETALEQRRTQALSSPHTVIIAFFQLESILSFFTTKTTEILGAHAALTTLMTNARLEVLRTFFDMLRHATQKLLQSRPRDVGVPHDVQELLRMLKAMMTHMDQSLVTHADREAEFAPVLGAIADPILALAQHAELDEAKKSILKLNLLGALQGAMVGFSFAATKQAKVGELLQSECASFVEGTSAKLLSTFGLDERARDGAPELTWGRLQQFFTYTATAGYLTIPFIDMVNSVRMRETIVASVTERVCAAYEGIFAAAPPLEGIDAAALEPRKLRVLLDAAK